MMITTIFSNGDRIAMQGSILSLRFLGTLSTSGVAAYIIDPQTEETAIARKAGAAPKKTRKQKK